MKAIGDFTRDNSSTTSVGKSTNALIVRAARFGAALNVVGSVGAKARVGGTSTTTTGAGCDADAWSAVDRARAVDKTGEGRGDGECD